MRRTALTVVLASAVVLGPAAPALAHPSIPLDPTLPLDVTYEATDNIEYLGRFPEHFGTAGGFPSEDGKTFYLTDPRGVYTYDITDPAKPKLLDSVAVYQAEAGTALAQEDPDTNGQILLVDGATTPAVLAPPETWRAAVGYGAPISNPAGQYAHDLTEIRPGLVMTAGRDAILMDTTDPTSPVKLTAVEQPGRFLTFGYHSVEWGNDGRDPYIVMGTEIAPSVAPQLGANGENKAGSDCKGENAVIETWDARAVLAALAEYQGDGERKGDVSLFQGVTFTKIQSFDASGRGIFLDGKAPGSQLYCAHWMELQPRADGSARMVVAYYNRGTRFVDVAADGKMTEFGWITPAEGYTGSAQWVSDDVVYIMDYRRGLELVRVKPAAAQGVVTNDVDVIAAGSTFVLPTGLHGHGQHLALGGLGLLLVLLLAAERVVRRRELAAAL
jgi:hypothetical protein